MAVNTQSFQTMVQNAVGAMQGAASALVDLTVGSVLRAFVDAYCGLALWLQGIALQVAGLTRFSTSSGADADSWAADYGFTRLPASMAQGAVTFSRFTPTAQALITAATQSGTTSSGLPIWTGGTIVQTLDGTEQFQVIPDTTQSAYSSALNSYVIGAGVSSAIATVQCTTAGTGGNVAAGLIAALGSAIPGVDSVTNAAAFTSGANAETDTAFRARFVLYLQSLTEGTVAACINAVKNLQNGASCVLVENQTYSGTSQPGYFYCIVNDGTGSPSGTFLSNAYAAIDKVRAEGTTFGVFAPTIVTANIAMVITAASGYTLSTLEAQVTAAITTYIQGLIQGQTLPWSKLGAIAWGVTGVSNVTGVTLNSGTSDLVPTSQQLIQLGTISVT